jgi:basic membrane protein A
MGLAILSGLATPASAQEGVRIGLVTDVGEVDDRSFNQSAWEGAQMAAEAVGGTADYVQTADPADYATNIGLFADQGFEYIITVGFALGDATLAAAQTYPDTHFIAVDVPIAFLASEAGLELPNITGLVFPEAQSGFLAGVLAARMSTTGTIAAVLGTDQVVPVVNFKEGYEAGAQYADPDIEILSTYHPGGLAVAFTDPAWGAQTAAQAIGNGADVVFGAGGKTGNGALEEVARLTSEDTPLYCIGVDTDQWETVPNAHPCLISSAYKDIRKGIADIITGLEEGTLAEGDFVGEVGLSSFHDFEDAVPQEVKDEIAALQEMFLNGELDPRTGEPPVEEPEATPEATTES